MSGIVQWHGECESCGNIEELVLEETRLDARTLDAGLDGECHVCGDPRGIAWTYQIVERDSSPS